MIRHTFKYVVRFLVASLVAFSMPCFAIQETGFFETYQQVVVPYFEKGVAGTFLGKDQVKISYRAFESDHATSALVLLPGRGEPIRKYAELIYDLAETYHLKDLGFSIYMMEHRGQGESGLIEGCNIQFVHHYRDYVQDLNTFMDQVVNPKQYEKKVLLAHSMGGAISVLQLLKNENRAPDFDKIILSAPMLDMNTKPYPKRIAHAYAHVMTSLGFGRSFAAGDSYRVTSSDVREKMSAQVSKDFSSIHPAKMSYQWILASLDALTDIQKSTKLSMSRLSSQVLETPILMLQAGGDFHIPAAGQNRFCDQMKNCTKSSYPGSLHEVLMERDEIRTLVIQDILNFSIK